MLYPAKTIILARSCLNKRLAQELAKTLNLKNRSSHLLGLTKWTCKNGFLGFYFKNDPEAELFAFETRFETPPGTKSFSNLKIKVNTRFAPNAFQGDYFIFSCFGQKIEIFRPKFFLKIVQITQLIYVSYMQAKNE